ncbi:MAG: thioredoxin [Hymenobacter sp.]|nr:MAG: thioredoxin [Hymenobacter sp.]
MPAATPSRLPPTAAAVLLVLLPAAAAAQPGRAGTQAMLDKLQLRLGRTIQVLVVDEKTDPDVVRSFRVAALPAFLLVRQGVELWRQPGLPAGEHIAEQLLQRVRRPGAAAPSGLG